MSGAALRPPRALAPPRPAGGRAEEREGGARPWLQLVAFAALGGYAAAYWASFVTAAPGGRVFAVVAIAVLLGAALIGLDRAPLPRPAVHLLAAALTLAALGFALVAMGLPAGLLKPARWDELGTLLDRGVSGLRTVTWPYGGGDPVVSLVVLLAIPPALIAAAALAFWPVRSRPGFEPVALVLLVALYGVAITDQSFDGEIGRGLVLLALIAAWLWLPSATGRTALTGALTVALAGLVALPVAAALDADHSWIDYQSWGIGGKPHAAERFDWNHRYGPIDWPRTGRTLLMVRSAEPHYWKAETLDYFDGLRWSHSHANDNQPVSAELPDQLDKRWQAHISFSVGALRSNLVIGAGTITAAAGDVGITTQTGDGTMRIADDPIADGSNYSVDAYVPDPSAAQMRAAPNSWNESLREYLAFSLPRPGQSALRVPAATDRRPQPFNDNRVAPPFRGEGAAPEAAAARHAIEHSPYARMYRLARRLSAGQPTTYDVVTSTERWLQRNLSYSERVPSHPYPLPAFLFQDKLGYCQQFSGAMALMLRMNGIPARVAGGFAPGIYEPATKEYRVRDLDAHSWVEVYFTGIGWVPFDPTPTLAPAGSQSGGDAGPSAAHGSRSDKSSSLASPRADESNAAAGPSGGSSDGKTLGLWALPLVLLALALGGLGVVVAYSIAHERRHRRSTPADGQLAELRSALARMGRPVPPGTTLTALERQLATWVGPAAARYARLVRERRYAPDGAGGPDRSDRAALRRELGAAGGRLGRLRSVLALPPRPASR
ncbi:MAG: protein-glutamine gamma-glutamyltransferase [Thermoleophilaceae bacterium]|nr:protein-glutamine gamma-glutamyltransferase [Thermoleophilaceae bacterium]